MPLFWYTRSKKHTKGMLAGTEEEWDKVEKAWKEDHPILNVINHIWDFFYYPIERKIAFILGIPYEIKYFFQRGFRGWADRDLWGYDYYIAKVNSQALKKLKEIQHILPTWEEGEDEEVARKRWHGIMDDMIFAFDFIAKEGGSGISYWYEGCEEHHKNLLEKHPNLFKDHHFQTKEEYDRMKKGMNLFIEHYFSLWD